MRYVDDYRARTGDAAYRTPENASGAAGLQRSKTTAHYGSVRWSYPCHLQIWSRPASAREHRVYSRRNDRCIPADGTYRQLYRNRQPARRHFLHLWRRDACARENGSLLQAKARGADIRIVYSPMDALTLAADNPTRKIVFFGLGFITMPATAITLQQARARNIKNFSFSAAHYAHPHAA